MGSVRRIGNSHLVIDDTSGITATELRSKCRKLKIEQGLDLVIIDYLQLMSGSGKQQRREQTAGNFGNLPFSQSYGARIKRSGDRFITVITCS